MGYLTSLQPHTEQRDKEAEVINSAFLQKKISPSQSLPGAPPLFIPNASLGQLQHTPVTHPSSATLFSLLQPSQIEKLEIATSRQFLLACGRELTPSTPVLGELVATDPGAGWSLLSELLPWRVCSPSQSAVEESTLALISGSLLLL